MQKLLILGAGGYGRTVAEAAAGQFETAFLDDASPLALAPCARYAFLCRPGGAVLFRQHMVK